MTSPFSEGRFEHEAKHIYYLPKSCFPQLEQPRPTYLIGSRGSGKTTLMKALHWQERLENETLKSQLDGTPFRGAFIGNYVKLPKIQLRCFDEWLEAESENNYGLLFGLYLDLTCLELISHSIAELLAGQALAIPSSVERDSVETWLEDYPEFLTFQGDSVPRSVSDFRARMRMIRRALEKHAMRKSNLQLTLDEIPVDQIGAVATSVAKRMADLCESDSSPRKERWHFKVCMDEGESLNSIQQRVVNTIIRLSEWPLFHFVSYVSRPDDMTTTLAPQLTQQKADRQVITIDEFDRSSFVELAEGVATVRCREALNESSFQFDSRRVLGTLNLNRQLKGILERSENPKAKQLLERAKAIPTESGEATALPIYETYLAEQLDLTVDGDSRADQRRLESSQYRKKMVGASLSICRDLKLKQIPFASADAMLSISDNCIRDFLSQLDHIYGEANTDLPTFVNSEVDWEVQSRALRSASLEKRDSIPESGILSPVETGRVVKGLARITASIQSWSDDKRHLRSTERGLFRIVAKGSESAELERAIVIVQDAADAGFLRVKNEGGQIAHFRVHASLAPAYGFSYRGAYYPVSLTIKDFNALKTADSDKSLERVADAIAERLSTQPPESPDPDYPLFEGANE